MMMSVRELRALEIERRAINSAYHILETGDTIRGTAKCMGVSKSTTHKDLQERLPQMGKLVLHDAVQEILDIHTAEKPKRVVLQQNKSTHKNANTKQ